MAKKSFEDYVASGIAIVSCLFLFVGIPFLCHWGNKESKRNDRIHYLRFPLKRMVRKWEEPQRSEMMEWINNELDKLDKLGYMFCHEKGELSDGTEYCKVGASKYLIKKGKKSLLGFHDITPNEEGYKAEIGTACEYLLNSKGNLISSSDKECEQVLLEELRRNKEMRKKY